MTPERNALELAKRIHSICRDEERIENKLAVALIDTYAKLERARAAIENASHGYWCILRKSNQGRVACNCWKARALVDMCESPTPLPSSNKENQA